MKRVVVIRAVVTGPGGLALLDELPESVKPFCSGHGEIQTCFRFPEEETAAMTTFAEMARRQGLQVDHRAQLESVEWPESDDRFYSLYATETEDTNLGVDHCMERVTCMGCRHPRERFRAGVRPQLFLYDEPEGGMFTPRPPSRKPPGYPETYVRVLTGQLADELVAAALLETSDLLEAEMLHGCGRYFVLAPHHDLGMAVGTNPCSQCGYSSEGHGLLPLYRRPDRPVGAAFTNQYSSLSVLVSARLRRHLAGRPNISLAPIGWHPDDVDAVRFPTFAT